MTFSIITFLSKYWMWLVLILLILLSLALLTFYIIKSFIVQDKSFKDNLNEAKQVQIAVHIDMEEKKVEKYYLYDQTHKDECISLDEFYVRFDKINAEKLRKWLNNITKVTDFNKTRRIELVMYDNNNTRGVYLVELDSYNDENKRFFLTFKDMTDSINVFRRAGKISVTHENEQFFEKANERISVTDDDACNYLVAIRYKDYEFAKKELQNDILRLIEDNIYNKIKENKAEIDLFTFSGNGTFLLFTANVINEKKYKQSIKKLLNTCSGEYTLIKNKLSYSINLVAGYTKINRDEKLTIDKCLEAEAAANSLVTKGRFADKLQLFDEHIQSIHNVMNNKLLAVEKVITQDLFSVKYIPILSMKNKTVCGYEVKVELPHALNMDIVEFMGFAKQRSFRVTFFSKIFKQVLTHSANNNKYYYLSFDFDNLSKVMEAYQTDERFKDLKIYYCLEFSNITMQKTDLITIEKTMTHYIDELNVKFGISYNTLSTIYLNAKIYSKAEVIMMTGQLIESALDKYSNEGLIDVYTKVASSYGQDIVATNVRSIALYELLAHYKISKVGGTFFTPFVIKNKIEDKVLLKTLNDIETRPY